MEISIYNTLTCFGYIHFCYLVGPRPKTFVYNAMAKGEMSFEDVPVADVGTNSFKFVYLNEEWLARFLTRSQQLLAT